MRQLAKLLSGYYTPIGLTRKAKVVRVVCRGDVWSASQRAGTGEVLCVCLAQTRVRVVLAVVASMTTASQPTQHMFSLLYSIRIKPFSPQSYDATEKGTW